MPSNAATCRFSLIIDVSFKIKQFDKAVGEVGPVLHGGIAAEDTEARRDLVKVGNILIRALWHRVQALTVPDGPLDSLNVLERRPGLRWCCCPVPGNTDIRYRFGYGRICCNFFAKIIRAAPRLTLPRSSGLLQITERIFVASRSQAGLFDFKMIESCSCPLHACAFDH